MNRNVEIKARVDGLGAVRERVEALADEGPVVLSQEDTFFVCPKGRLKLRKTQGRSGELIYYQRPDSPGPKESQYTICRLSDPAEIESLLAQAYGVRGVVTKRRALYRVGQTRVHLDEVDGLGAFVELEVVLDPDQGVSEGMEAAFKLMDQLDVPRTSLVAGAYIDLLEGLRG